jgi:hypothetical protein
MTARCSILTIADGSNLEFPYNHGSNLPLMLPSVNQAMAGLTFEDRQYLSQPNLLCSFLSVADETNQNLTASQKDCSSVIGSLVTQGSSGCSIWPVLPVIPLMGSIIQFSKRNSRESLLARHLCALHASLLNKIVVARVVHLNDTRRRKTSFYDVMTNFIPDGKCRLTNIFHPFPVVCLIRKAKSPRRTNSMMAHFLWIMCLPTFI